MTIFRNWTAINPVTAEPQRNATASWWHYCDDCTKLTELPGPDGPSGMVADSDEGVPAETVAAASGHVCQRGWTPDPEPVTDNPRAHVWTADEDEIVANNTIMIAAGIIGIGGTAVARRRKVLGIGKQVPADTWNAETDQVVMSNPVKTAASILKLSREAVAWRRKTLIAEGRMADKPRATAVVWTPELDEIVLKHTPSVAEKMTGLTRSAIKNRRYRLAAMRASSVAA